MAESVNDFVAGWVGGAAGILVGSPLDVLKARLQAPKQDVMTGPRVGAWDTLTRMVHVEGVGSLFKGVMAPVMGLAGLNAILFVSYGSLLRLLHPGDGPASLTDVYLAGCGGGMASFFFSTPTELIKIKAQVARTNKTVVDVSRQIYKQHGLGGLYQGGLITLIRDAPSYGVYFWVYEGMKRMLDANGGANEVDAWRLLLAGGLAGTISWTSIYPIDVIKSRLQMQAIPGTALPVSSSVPPSHANPVGSVAAPAATLSLHRSSRHSETNVLLQRQRHHQQHQQSMPYTSIRDCIVRSYQAEGISVFYRGLAPTVVRAFPVNAVTFWVYELVMHWLSRE